ncbi:AAA family ATPase [Bacteroides sp. 519]|uniref:AAA family ATPase n=1 Tax=Bacteroides sp. 519 TaxID=2302937 RepID=UPI0013CFFE93|nr:AAA family ATPase [Bacteroides sp. 519]NDV56598.1 ATPase [Bacteroides sp. 519]
MGTFLTDIKVVKLLHLQDFNIHIDNEEKKHLIITGKNGTGKTLLLNAIGEYLNVFIKHEAESLLPQLDNINWSHLTGGVELTFNNPNNLAKSIDKSQFILAFYEAERGTSKSMVEPESPDKPNLQPVQYIKAKKTNEFLKFLADLKIQEALAQVANQTEDVNNIQQWFVNFEEILKDIFEDRNLKLQFNYKDYSFKIASQGKIFGFNHFSDGYYAIIDIAADLILKMQEENRYNRVFDKEGIVLIDEIETHLHLELQRLILPLLTRIFPNIQFIVTTHSPFVLGSLSNAIAFDLERKQIISDDLTDYSYESLAEGYFGVETISGDLENRIERLKELVHKERNTTEDEEMNLLLSDFEKIPEAVAPNIKSAYFQLKRELLK